MLQLLSARASTNDVVILLDNSTESSTTTTGTAEIDNTTTTTAPTTTTGATDDKFVYQGSLNLTMSAEDVNKLTNSITTAKNIFEAAIASETGLKASEVTVTKIYVDGDRKLRRLAGATDSVIDVEFTTESDKQPVTNFQASDLEAAIEKEAKAEGIDGIDVTVTKSSLVLVSSPPAPASPPEDDSSSVAIVVTVLVVCLVIFGMIGGLIYWYREEIKTWYYRRSASMKAGQASESAEGQK